MAPAKDIKTASNNLPSMDELKSMMDEMMRLKTENDELKKHHRPITFSVSEKGAVSVSGIGKYPYTLFKNQWDRILEKKDDLLAFIEENKANLN
jgi:hypothetical protein